MNNKLLAIRHIIFRVAQEYLKFHKRSEDDWAYFNEYNNFNFEKCLLLPYIITIANGKKEDFLNGVFENSFYPELTKNNGVTIGHLDGDYNEITNDNLTLTFDQSGKLNIPLDGNGALNSDGLNDTIKERINHSIEFIIKRRYPEFANFNSSLLKEISYDNDAFEYILELKEIGALAGMNKTQITQKFQNIILEFPFFISYIKEIEEQYNFA